MHSTSSPCAESGSSWADFRQFGSCMANCGTCYQPLTWVGCTVLFLVRSWFWFLFVFKHKEWPRLLKPHAGLQPELLALCFHHQLYQAELLLCHISPALTFSTVCSCHNCWPAFNSYEHNCYSLMNTKPQVETPTCFLLYANLEFTHTVLWYLKTNLRCWTILYGYCGPEEWTSDLNYCPGIFWMLWLKNKTKTTTTKTPQRTKKLLC